MAKTYQLQSFSGPFTDGTRAIPSLAWLESYTENICALGFSDPSNRWYAPSSVYYNCDGRIVRGGSNIWEWVGAEVFDTFAGIDVRHDETRVRIIYGGAGAYYEDDELKKKAPQDADVVLYEHMILFTLKNEKLRAGGPIAVRRMMEWIVGEAEDGAGCHGMQCWQGKVCWDTSVVKNEMVRRMKAVAQ